jgi:hypothetical protein
VSSRASIRSASISGVSAHSPSTLETRQRTRLISNGEKHEEVFSVFGCVFTGWIGSANAQQQEAVLQYVELPGPGFDIVLATSKSPAGSILGNSPDALVLPLIGGELALVFDDGWKMMETIDSLQRPVCAFQAESKDGKSTKPVAVYVVPKRETTANIRTPEARMRKVEIPGNDLFIVLATTKPPIALEPHERPDVLFVYAAGSELIMATDGDIERMFKDVGLSQWPVCAFYVEHKRSNPSQAASVYIIPKGDMGTSID